jgi:hypothetical protein
MSRQYRIQASEQQINSEKSQEIATHLEEYLGPLVECLDAYLDKRLVRTLVQAVAAIVTFRNQKQGLNISELGTYITNPAQAPAGTKRLDNLLDSPKWSKEVIDESLLTQAHKQKQVMEKEEEQLLYIWDGSVMESPYSEQVEGMCAVISSKAKNL